MKNVVGRFDPIKVQVLVEMTNKKTRVTFIEWKSQSCDLFNDNRRKFPFKLKIYIFYLEKDFLIIAEVDLIERQIASPVVSNEKKAN